MSTATAEEVDIKITLGDNWKVICHNDDVTTVEFVIVMLMTVFKKIQAQAVELTYTIHENGHAVAGEYSSYEIAEQKVAEATDLARLYGYPLKLTIEQ